jgi:hypothetical protein
MISLVATIPKKYILVFETNTDRVMHFNASLLHTPNNNYLETIPTIPVFDTLKSINKFQKEILEKKRIIPTWFVSKEEYTNECVIYSHIKNELKTPFTKIIDSDLEDEIYTEKLMMNNIGLFYVEDFWVKESLEQLVMIGNLWTPPKCMSGETYDLNHAREFCENTYLN